MNPWSWLIRRIWPTPTGRHHRGNANDDDLLAIAKAVGLITPQTPEENK